MAKRVILMGKGTLSIRVAEWFLASPDYDLALIVPVIPEPAWTDSLSAWAAAHNIPIVPSGHFKDIPGVMDEDWKIDLAFSVFYDRIIKDWFIQKCHRILNLHNGPLPKYRGVSPINWALKNEEDLHGVTIHEITPGIDDGPIIGQVQYSIYPAIDEVATVYSRALEFAWTLFQQTMPLVEKITPRPQDGAKATYYSAKENDQLAERRYFTREESLRKLQGK